MCPFPSLGSRSDSHRQSQFLVSLRVGARLAEALLSHLFFLATDSGGNSWCNLTAHVLRASALCVVPVASSPWNANIRIQLIPHPSSGPGLVWAHMFVYPSMHPFIYPCRGSFINSMSLMWASLRALREESPPGVPTLVGEVTVDTMIAHYK